MMKTKLVIFGITGDLSRRKLLPALQHIVKSGEFNDLSIIGVSRREVDVTELVETATGASDLVDLTKVFTMNLAVAGDYVRLKDYLELADDEQALIYLSVPPNAAADIVDFLGEAGLNSPRVKILFEKPFGFDLASAQDFIERTGRYFDDKQLYRIDHYAAKEVAAEVIRMRSAAGSKHHQWTNESVASVSIVASETIGIEGRTEFYEQTGALRDFIQGHLMQQLSLVLMDLRAPFTIDDLSARRLEALEVIAPADPNEAVRGQYEGYQTETQNPGSLVETFVSVELHSNDPRWTGVPLRLTTGKALDVKRSAIVIEYTDGSVDEFDEAAIAAVNTQFSDAYERVLVEAIRGRKYIFTTGPEVIRSWEIVAPIQRSWDMDDTPPIQYAPGTSVNDLI